MNYNKIRNNPTQFKALTSLTVEQFDEIYPLFVDKWLSYIDKYTFSGKFRQRKYVARQEDGLASHAEKLFFILYYKKNNPLQEALAASFDLKQDMANKWIHVLTPILEKVLKPFAPTSNPQRINAQMLENETYLMDATERPVQRDTYEQEDFYSGKKKMHTVKNLLIISTVGLILYLSPTVIGKTHDKPLAEHISPYIQKKVEILADLAFLGVQTDQYTLQLPHKKPKNKELTKIQKVQNRLLSRKRVKVENAIAHIKTIRIVKDKNRNYKLGFRDTIIKIACALHNFKVLKRIQKNTFCL